jgi:hypothetical protein
MGKLDGDAPVAIKDAAERGRSKCWKNGVTAGRENQSKSSHSEGVLTPQVYLHQPLGIVEGHSTVRERPQNLWRSHRVGPVRDGRKQFMGAG